MDTCRIRIHDINKSIGASYLPIYSQYDLSYNIDSHYMRKWKMPEKINENWGLQLKSEKNWPSRLHIEEHNMIAKNLPS